MGKHPKQTEVPVDFEHKFFDYKKPWIKRVSRFWTGSAVLDYNNDKKPAISAKLAPHEKGYCPVYR